MGFARPDQCSDCSGWCSLEPLDREEIFQHRANVWDLPCAARPVRVLWRLLF